MNVRFSQNELIDCENRDPDHPDCCCRTGHEPTQVNLIRPASCQEADTSVHGMQGVLNSEAPKVAIVKEPLTRHNGPAGLCLRGQVNLFGLHLSQSSVPGPTLAQVRSGSYRPCTWGSDLLTSGACRLKMMDNNGSGGRCSARIEYDKTGLKFLYRLQVKRAAGARASTLI